MPINASYEYYKAESKYQQASSPQAKLEALYEMARFAPSHKGGENLRKEISRKIAKLKTEIEKAEAQAAKRSGGSLAVRKEGAGQIVLVGLPNSGKSTVLKALTNADVEIADYEFTTTSPQVGMMDFFGAKIQLVELPAIIEGSSQGKALGTQLLSMVRTADAVVLVLDAQNAVSEFEVLQRECNAVGIRLNEKPPAIVIRQGEYKGISVSGLKFLKVALTDFEAFLKTHGIFNAAVIVREPVVSLKQVADVLNSKLVYKRALALVNAKTKPIEKKDGFFLTNFSHCFFSVPSELDEFKKDLFLLLDKVVVYTKKPGQDPDLSRPLVLETGSSVLDLARIVHKELGEKIQHAKLFGQNARFKGQKVPRDYELQNFDIIEIEL